MDLSSYAIPVSMRPAIDTVYGKIPFAQDASFEVMPTDFPGVDGKSVLLRERRFGTAVSIMLGGAGLAPADVNPKKLILGVLNYGFVELQDYMGSDQEVINAARTSYTGAGLKSDDAALLDYLWRHQHTTPFEMGQLRFRIYLPIVVYRQLFRHRTAVQCEPDGAHYFTSNDHAFQTFSVQNEMSGRYVEMPDHYYVPEPYVITPQSKTNKQGREASGFTPDDQLDLANKFHAGTERARHEYEEFLGGNVAKEISRNNLPLTQYTLLIWKIDLKNLLHFLSLRLHSHAQYEVRQYARALALYVAALFPWTWQAFLNHTKDAVRFSADEMRVLQLLLDESGAASVLVAEFGKRVTNKRRQQEFAEKLGLKV